MIKTLGQNGLNFIASKYKELKSLLNTKADKSEIKTKLSELTEDSTHRTVTDTEKSTWNNKVDKIAGKGLSTNDYDNTAKSKVDAIPTNPKYTDTVTSVVNNLTTADATKALSANQGKVLQDNKADKSNISRCKTRGWNTISVWQPVENTRDLEDWIGDFDKRTRELKSGGEIQTFDQEINEGSGRGYIWGYKVGKIVTVAGSFRLGSDDAYNNKGLVFSHTLPNEFRPVTSLDTVGPNCSINVTPRGDVRFIFGVINSFERANGMAGCITYVTSN